MRHWWEQLPVNSEPALTVPGSEPTLAVRVPHGQHALAVSTCSPQSTALARICSLGTAPSDVEAHLESQHAAAARASMEYRLEAFPEVLRRPRGLSGGSSSDAIALPVVPMAASASGRRNSITLRVSRRWSSPAEEFPAWAPATLETRGGGLVHRYSTAIDARVSRPCIDGGRGKYCTYSERV